jgi:phage/plasmid-associated DNA primase
MLEYTNIKKVYGFIKNEMGISFLSIKGTKRGDFISVKDNTELEQIIRYKEIYNRNDDAFQTAVFLPKHKWGRVIPANNYLSLAIMRRETRHSFCDGYYRDIDMINAQPTIIYEVAKQNDKKMEALETYIHNTKKIREIIMKVHKCDKDTAKNLPITIMMGGTYDGWIREWDIQENTDDNDRILEIQKIEVEMNDIINIVFAFNQHIKKDVLRQDPTKWRNENEMKRGVMGLWCQSVERLIQETAIKYLTDTKNFLIEKIVPCQDGFMILKDLWYENIISDINNVIKNKFGINILFTEKPFDEKIDIPLFEDGKPYHIWEDLLSAKQLSVRYLNDFGKFILKYNSSVFVFHNNRWYDETETKSQHKITLTISEKLYDNLKKDINGDVSLQEDELISLLKLLRNNTSSSHKINDIVKHILSNAPETQEDFNQKPFLLGFNNGVYDLEKDEFRDYRYDDYITMTTKYDYEDIDYGLVENEDNTIEDYLSKDENGEYLYEISEEQIKLWNANREIKDELINIFEDIHSDKDNLQLYFQILASGLDGIAYQKLFLFNGQGGNGKGLTQNLMKSVLGDYFICPNNGILKDVETASSPSPNMLNLKNKRYINFKEVSGSIRVAMLRNLTGGGEFSGRMNHKDPVHFNMSGTFVMEFNLPPELDGKPQQADYRRLVDILFPYNFTDDENKIGKIIDGVLFKKANPYYANPQYADKVKKVFLDMLLKVYRVHKKPNIGMEFIIPQSIRDRTEKFIENQNRFQKIFKSIWRKVTDDDSKEIKEKTFKLRDMFESVTSSDEYKTLTYREKREYSRDAFYKWIGTLFNIEGNDKTAKTITGIAYLESEDI